MINYDKSCTKCQSVLSWRLALPSAGTDKLLILNFESYHGEQMAK